MAVNRQESSKAVGFVTILPSEYPKEKKKTKPDIARTRVSRGYDNFAL